MKDWLSIGKFSEKSGFSVRGLRVYEQLGLLPSHARGANGYRYYRENQLEQAARIKGFKHLGFTLTEIKSLLDVDAAIDSKKLTAFLEQRLAAIGRQQNDLSKQQSQVEQILSSLKKTNTGLKPVERRYIMGKMGQVSIVVTGIKDLEKTARNIAGLLRSGGHAPQVLSWEENIELPEAKPFILILPEQHLNSEQARKLQPDVVVIKDLSSYDSKMEANYLGLYSAVGPHMTTVFNADDRISVQLAANSDIRKGRTFYYSKNSALEEQIKNIGGVVSDGEDISLFGFNLSKEAVKMKLEKWLGFDEEIALLASLAAVLDIGLNVSTLKV